MARVRIPGGVVTPAQWLAMDALAEERANGTLRLTTRQTIQFHGIIKTNPQAGRRGDQCGAARHGGGLRRRQPQRHLHAQPVSVRDPRRSAGAGAGAISTHLRPRTGAYHEIWIDGDKIAGGEEAAEDEPIYGRTYMPRKFKIAVAVPPHNDVDVFAHDLGLIAIVEGGRHRRLRCRRRAAGWA